jgi:hypothetical protein
VKIVTSSKNGIVTWDLEKTLTTSSYKFHKSGALKDMTTEELKEADADTSLITFNRGIVATDGRPYWLYIAVKPSKSREFMEATRAGKTIKFRDFGEILEYGFEKEVPASMKQKMKEKYGCDDNYMEKLNKDVFEAQVLFFRQQEAARIADIVEMLKKKQERRTD